jgi:hypothetical protein
MSSIVHGHGPEDDELAPSAPEPQNFDTFDPEDDDTRDPGDAEVPPPEYRV